MRIILPLLLIITFLFTASAKNYYFSDVSGNDFRTVSQAQSPSTPWKTLNKLNSFFGELQPGDSVFFKRGETFYGSIIATKSGTVSHPIVISAYGTGSKPVITGLQNLYGWSSSGNGKYVSYNSFFGESVNMVIVNGVERAMGRYPNSNAGNGGYLSFESHAENSITDKQLLSSPDWKGAELVVRTNRFVLDRVKITGQSGNKLSYSPALSYDPTDGFGYFVQNDIRTLDQFGEWYYNPATHKLDVYFGTSSASAFSIQASVMTNVVYVYNKHNIVFDNLTVTGANYYDFYLYSSNNIVIRNCNISFAGRDAINISNATNVQIENNTIANTNNIAINLRSCNNSLIKNNEIKNTGLIPGLGVNNANKTVAIRETGSYNVIEYNQIDSTGSSAIRFDGDYSLIKNNFINHFNLTKDDGGGIYTGSTYGVTHYGKKIIGNIVLNGIGAAAGTTYHIAASTTGIYLDDYTSNVEVTGNTVANCSRSGTFLHNASNIILRNNTLYNSPSQLVMTHDYAAVTSPLRNNIVKNNILFSKNASELVFAINSITNDLGLAGNIDSNYYCRPLDDNFIIKSSYLNSKGLRITQNLELKGWQTMYKKDMASKGTPLQIIPFKLKNLVGSNKFANGEFNTNISGAKIYSTAARYSTSWVGDKLDKGTFQGIVSSATPCVYSVYIPVGPVKPGKNYLVTFSIQNSKDTVLNVFIRQSPSPYNVLSNSGLKTVMRAGPDRKDYEFAFSPEISDPNPLLIFETNSQKNSMWLDNIKIYEADVAITNPDDSVRFEYNATQSNKTVPLDGTYVDARGTSYTDNIVLLPYTSAVLIRKNKAAISAPAVKITSPAINASFRAVAAISLTATASDPGGTIKKVEFYNGTELLHTEFIAPYTFLWKNVLAGKYTITAKATNNNGKVATSAGVPISVVASAYPVVKITTPATNSRYTSPATIGLAATASEAGGKIKKVEFFKGTDLLHTEFVGAYTFSWKNVPAGSYKLTARAVDDEGNMTTSAVVSVSVVAPSYPVVKITSPVMNAKYNESPTITLTAAASDADGTISKVEFYDGSTLLTTEKVSPYSWSWKKVPAGNHTIIAKATDNSGKVTVSQAITISVKSSSTVMSSAGNSALISVTNAGNSNQAGGTENGSNPFNFTLFPNPAINKIQIYFDEFHHGQKANVSIIDLLGKTVKSIPLTLSGQKIDVDISSLNTGVYILRFSGENAIINKKFVKTTGN